MYRINVRRHFDAAHYLRGYHGKCEAMHGHRWHVVVSVISNKLNEIGLAIDFREIKRNIDDVLGKYDHTLLNDNADFQKENPSTENLSRIIFNKLSPALQDGAKVASVEVWETPDTWVCYSEDSEEGADV